MRPLELRKRCHQARRSALYIRGSRYPAGGLRLTLRRVILALRDGPPKVVLVARVAFPKRPLYLPTGSFDFLPRDKSRFRKAALTVASASSARV